MRPLAAPVLGGMVSSFLHVMILTPILYITTQQLKSRRD
jgi:Cu/Ag efflux pump CusA